MNELKVILADFEKKLKEKNMPKIDRVQLIGGVTRIPALNKMIREYFTQPVATNVNGDDGPTLGAAFIAANYSAGIKVKKIQFNDGPNYNVEYDI